ncbi:hypothetical protein M409DRAFT_49014 [Zasmidium cellare ATCC 36951]|uniref:Frequency clock protein n=1 Tax=Zasmidium cellare ATCC 36951 TaxID=1080233 RepID=A0A6A6D504_ZASCE|nr:uncharacterized protein M409DRAFT_49014 [Zasmidium cellare ATCC 36951]KAF2174145.1 hypothetical protein M409DRAFT_49014 [Zasmidium cellare ATCC 36951]
MADQLPHPTIVMTPPPVSSTSNPRRPPAHRSVSLLHSPRRKPPPAREPSDSSSDGPVSSTRKVNGSMNGSKGSSDSPSSLQPLGRDSSGESSNAEKWFERSNNEVRDNSAPFADNDPPFFMRNSSSSETPPEAQQQMRQFLGVNDGSNSLPLRTGLMHLGTDGSSTEDFRSVIDDLTIENKKLKRRLKKYEKLHDSHLRDEKLFEVRIHGLPAEKKRELEETLRKFASSLGTNGFPANGYEGLLPVLPTHKTASSQTSLQNTDSAYASMSASGQGSSALSGGETRYNKQQQQSGVNTASRRQNIHSYLHHIPEGLLPQPNPTNMTERAKKKLVVRRLEQIFAGKGAMLGAHQHPMQQQEVSHMAARADRAANEAQGQRSGLEGFREAHIMSQKAGDAAELAEAQNKGGQNEPSVEESSQEKPTHPLTEQALRAKGNNGDQRPTRPLDLDPDRAQVPADNIRYMRHLGFSPPDPATSTSPEEGHGWVYLNLLINMAQLHTINVTADFVRKALTEMSSKFELSDDGRKVRWKGGKSVTRTSSSGGGSSNERTSNDTPDRISPRKRPKLSHRDSHRSGTSHAKAGASKSARTQAENKVVYTPLFFHKDSTDRTESSSEEEEDSEESPYPMPLAGDSSGMTSSGIRTISTRRKKQQEDGPIIFYNNARFCTDLSGDRKAIGNANAPPYTTVTSTPVGQPQKPAAAGLFERRGPLAEAVELPEPMDIGDNPIPASMELSFPPRSPMESQKRKFDPVEMEVTGIGGVWPADNFAIAVESRHARIDQSSAPSVKDNLPNKRIPEKFARILKDSGPGRKIRGAMHKQQIVATNVKQLPPSELPPALGFPFGDDSMGDDESDVDDDISVSPESPHAFPPSAAPQPVELHYTSSDEEEDDEDDDDESDDGSLDLLAAARQIDPEAIREQEREYDANVAERLAEEIPAGSSAATAGGGSGFASPASGMNREDYQRALKEARARPADLKRSKTTDSMKVQKPAQSSAEDSDEEMDQ